MNSFSALVLINQVANWQRVQNPNYFLWYEKEPGLTFGAKSYAAEKQSSLFIKQILCEREEGGNFIFAFLVLTSECFIAESNKVPLFLLVKST